MAYLGPGRDPARLSLGFKPDVAVLTSMTYDNARIIEGFHYFLKTFTDVSGEGTIVRFLFTVPKTTRIFAKVGLWASAAFTVEIYEDVVTTSDGTPLSGFNNNRNSARVHELSPFATPSIDEEGTLIWATKTDATKESSGVAAGTNYFIYVKQESKYMFKITKSAAGDGFVDFDFYWVEQEED